MTRPTSDSDRKGPWATFHLGNEIFAVSAEDVQEVMMPQPLTPVPLAPPHVLGLLNLRGQIMPAIDLRHCLRFEPLQPNASQVFLVVKSEDSLVSVVVDGIGDVLEIEPKNWQPPPETLAPAHRKFIFGIVPLEHTVVSGLRVQMLGGDEPAVKGAQS
jgi:purine-binding chemotaxis protein CheW